jgi:hypothetical protein
LTRRGAVRCAQRVHRTTARGVVAIAAPDGLVSNHRRRSPLAHRMQAINALGVNHMKKLLTVVALAFAAVAVQAQDKAPSAQQTKMGECNKEAGDKKGDERKAFMKTCLSAKKKTQQDKMKACNKDAGDKKLKGDDRKKFMSDCLKG